MVLSRHVLAVGALVSAVLAHAPELGRRAPFQAVGIEKNKDGFGAEPLAADDYQAQFAPLPQLGKKNATIPQLKDRSAELMARQDCDAGYWYCPTFGRCCPTTSDCCSWGYCIDPDDTCCVDGPCDPGWNCCSSNCSPPGGDCCSDGHYCEAGNVCVRLGTTGQIVCCTDLQCTAAVVSGTTSYVSSTQNVPPPSNPPSPSTPEEPPSSITPPPSSTPIFTAGGDSYTTWYWTVTWWYLSFYWSTFQQVESTVTYTRIYETTTYTTTATDEEEASSLFYVLSETLTFTPPADAHTSLASLINQPPLNTDSFSFENPFSTVGIPNPFNSSIEFGPSSTTTEPELGPSAATASPKAGAGGEGAANAILVPSLLIAVGALSGVLMVLL